MKYIIVIFAICFGLQKSISQEKSNDFKVITYNIWNGFDWGKDEVRRGQLQNWMKAQNPNVVALQELCNYTAEKLKADALVWGHKYSVLLKTTGYSVGITSKYPIEVKEKIREGMHHGALHCKTNEIDFLVVHLHPGSIKRRREEAKILSKKIEVIKKSNSKYIVLGDFNAHSPFDADLYKTNGQLMQRLRKSNKDKGLDGNLVNNELDFAVMSSFLSLPLFDVARKFTKGIAERGSFPGRILGEKNKESDEQLVSRLVRIDCIMVSSELYVKSIGAKVHNGQENWFLSDHYPVSTTFRLKN